MKILSDSKADTLSLAFGDLDDVELVAEKLAPGVERFCFVDGAAPVRVLKVVVSAVSALTAIGPGGRPALQLDLRGGLASDDGNGRARTWLDEEARTAEIRPKVPPETGPEAGRSGLPDRDRLPHTEDRRARADG